MDRKRAKKEGRSGSNLKSFLSAHLLPKTNAYAKFQNSGLCSFGDSLIICQSVARFLLLCFLSVISLCTSDYPRPLLISLPVSVGMGPMGQNQEEGNSAEEQRLAPRAYDPGQQQPSEGGPFLSWGGNQSPFMVLQLSDYISGTTQQQSQQDQSEEEFEKVEDTRDRKRHRRPPQQTQQRHQGAFDFDDFRRLPERRPDIEIGKKPKKKKQMSTTQARSPDPEGDEEDEEREGEVYGTDPVVHYLREKKKKGRRRYKIVEEDEEDFPMKDWWQY